MQINLYEYYINIFFVIYILCSFVVIFETLLL